MFPILRSFFAKPKNFTDERFGSGATRRMAIAVDEEVSRRCSYRGHLVIFLFDVVPPDARSGSLIINSVASGAPNEELPSPEQVYEELLGAAFRRIALELGYTGRVGISFKDRIGPDGYPFRLQGRIDRRVQDGTLTFCAINGLIEDPFDNNNGSYDEIFEPDGLARLEQYSSEFQAARRKAVEFGFSVPPNTPRKKSVLGCGDSDIAQAIIKAVQERYPLELMVGGCLHVSYFMRNIVESITGMRAFYTVGAVRFQEKELYRFTDAQLLNWIENGIPQGVEGLHAWLTLESMEIVDLTYFVTLAAVVPHLGVDAMPVLGSPAVLVGVKHTPLLSADDIIERLGTVNIFPA